MNDFQKRIKKAIALLESKTEDELAEPGNYETIGPKGTIQRCPVEIMMVEVVGSDRLWDELSFSKNFGMYYAEVEDRYDRNGGLWEEPSKMERLQKVIDFLKSKL